MLVLSRRQGQSVVIGDAIEVVIVQIQEDKVRIGVIAPPGIAVHRRETFPAIESPGDPPIEQPIEQLTLRRKGRCSYWKGRRTKAS